MTHIQHVTYRRKIVFKFLFICLFIYLFILWTNENYQVTTSVLITPSQMTCKSYFESQIS